MMPLLSLVNLSLVVALDLMFKYNYIREHRSICFTYSELVFLGINAMQNYVNQNTCLCKTTCDYASLNLQEKFCQSSLKVEKIQIYSQSQFGLGFLLEWFVWRVERLSCAMALVKDSVFPLLEHGFQLEFQRILPILSTLLCLPLLL